MVISMSIGDGLCVTVEVEGGYVPDVMDDLCARARDLFRNAHADMQHTTAEREPE